jgi:two-component system invasion response regulator UvrY
VKQVLVADDHPVVRRGIAEILDEGSEFAVAGQAADAAEVLRALEEREWDVLVLDLSMPGAQGIELLRIIRQRRPQLPVLVLSIHPEEQYALRCLKVGAAGYLSKESAPENLLEALRVVAGGRRYLSPSLADRLVEATPEEAVAPPHERLSSREREVMVAIAAGESVTDIGKRLGLSVKTVSTYRMRLLDKMGLAHNADLTRYALDHHLIE